MASKKRNILINKDFKEIAMHIDRRAILTLISALVFSFPAFAADTFNIDPVHSSVGFSVTHLVISHVNGNFTEFSGVIVYDPQDASKDSVDVHIKAGSLSTRNDNRDADVKSPNFLDVAKYPEITFKSTRVEKSGDNYTAYGSLIIHGISKDVALPFTVSGPVKDPWGNTRIGAQAGLTINRKDYGVNWNKTLDGGGAVVSDEVKIDLSVEAVKAK
jgi:polyisoprenoid-binding protein YceI